ncbi:helix-turn-helix transcriptional regulator [Erythrobacter sp. QSSC1-22B]|uniref:helix-turn-helix transcriptional regulator n=1 Tax=Erythrobacter sp. QSSC1-22B TaxID=1860125 RepID=UPI00143AC9F7|nr:helix-turn-helix transcriptional regulator [Erythrobacter sp. QSSC1-22B]
MYYDILPETLKTLRDRFGWSQQKLAEEAGIHRKTIISKENGEGKERTRDFVALKIAESLGVEVGDLGKSIPEEAFRLDIDVCCHLRRVLEQGDNFHSIKVLEYITYHLAEALDIAQLDLGPDWNVKALERPRPTLPTVPAGPIEISHGEIDEDTLLQLLVAWHSTFGEYLVDPNRMLSDPRCSIIHEIIKRLPVMERGKINRFWFKAYLRRVSGRVVNGHQILMSSTFDCEMWRLIKSDEL